MAAAAISALLLLWGSAHARRLKTVRYAVELGMEPGTRLVLLSDLHIGIFIGTGYLERVAAAVNRLEPELVVISGDLFDGYLPADDDQLGRAAGALRKILAPGGVYAVVGNHDPAVTDQRFHRFLKEAGIQLLHNEAVELENMNLVGRAGIVDSRDGRVPLGRLLQETEPRKRTVVLDHDPQGDPGGRILRSGPGAVRAHPQGTVFPHDHFDKARQRQGLLLRGAFLRQNPRHYLRGHRLLSVADPDRDGQRDRRGGSPIGPGRAGAPARGRKRGAACLTGPEKCQID